VQQYTEVKQVQGHVREFDEFEDGSVQRAPQLHENPYYKSMKGPTEERTEKKSRSKTRHMPVDESHPEADGELTGYSYRW
jgi:hypothetical protein